MPGVRTPFHETVYAEFLAWIQTLPTEGVRPVYPEVEAPGGLPPRWRLRASSHEAGRAGVQSVHVVDREAGGWILLRRVASGDTVLNEYEATFHSLYVRVRQFAQGPIQATRVWQPAERLMRQFLASCYDPADATEAAEQMLVVLGAAPRFLPAVLTSS